jgi:hypothetical protein
MNSVSGVATSPRISTSVIASSQRQERLQAEREAASARELAERLSAQASQAREEASRADQRAERLQDRSDNASAIADDAEQRAVVLSRDKNAGLISRTETDSPGARLNVEA